MTKLDSWNFRRNRSLHNRRYCWTQASLVSKWRALYRSYYGKH